MRASRRVVLCLVALAVLLGTVAACAQTRWPSALSYTIGLSSDESARIQTSAFLSGPLGGGFGAKIGGWWVTGGDDNRAFVADAYLDYQRQPLYLAAGRKFVPFGPAGVLVSPGVAGGELQLNYDRASVQVLTGTLAFTPVTGGTRFTFAGSRSPADENVSAGRVAVRLGEAPALPVTVGLNILGLLEDTGTSGDISIEAAQGLTLFGEAASFGDVDAHAYGIRYSDQYRQEDPSKVTILALYYRKVPIGFLPAAVGATQYFEDQTGWAGGLYHQLSPRQAWGLYADENDVILTLFGYLPL
jgi:hypothetical protein